MFPHLSKVSILAVALWLTLELSIATGQAQYRPHRMGRPMKQPQLKSGPDCPTPHFSNGVAKPLQRNKMIRFTCASGFHLVGNMYSMCEKGRWDTPIPICIRSGCPLLAVVDNGQISYEHGQAAVMLFCSSGYQVAGPSKAYCNGTHWDRPLGNCRETGIGVETICDFEALDYCGWMNEASHDFDWKRSDGIVSPKALKTGPKFDHTTGVSLAGHFMMVDSVVQFTNETARLLSPVYPANYSTNACFRFYYHMFGESVGTLSVYVRPMSQQLDTVSTKDASFVKSGNQRNVWNEGYFDLKQYSEGFQVVIEASLGMKFKSDIAIDDVSLLNGDDCRSKPEHEDVEVSSVVPEVPPPEVSSDDTIFKLGSCENRCDKNVSSVIAIDSSVNFVQCDCFEGCVDSKTCCPDYAERCVFNDPDNFNVITTSTTMSTTMSTTAKTRPTTTSSSSTSTTTARPTTMPTTTSTKPSTTSTTTRRSSTISTVRTTAPTTPKTTATPKSITTTTTKIYNLRSRTTTTTTTVRPSIIIPMVRTRKPITTTTTTTAQPTTEEVQLKLVARFGDLPSDDEFSPSMLELGDTKPNLARVFLYSGIGVVSFGFIILVIVLHIRRNSGTNVLNRLKQKSMKKHFGSTDGFEDVRFLAADEHLDFSIPEDDAEEAVEESEGNDDAGKKNEKKVDKKSSKKGKK